jgi:hypothetical protein
MNEHQKKRMEELTLKNRIMREQIKEIIKALNYILKQK